MLTPALRKAGSSRNPLLHLLRGSKNNAQAVLLPRTATAPPSFHYGQGRCAYSTGRAPGRAPLSTAAAAAARTTEAEDVLLGGERAIYLRAAKDDPVEDYRAIAGTKDFWAPLLGEVLVESQMKSP